MIIFTGDINLTDNAFDVGFGVGTKVKRGLNPFRHIVKQEEDVWVGNFEGVTSNVTCRKGSAKDMFRLSTDYLANCSNLIDYWGVANNHVMEHGAEAYDSMCDALQKVSKGIFASDANRTITFMHGSKKISIFGFSQRNDHTNYAPCYWNFPEYKDIEKELFDSDADYKVAYIHWGVEFINRPYHDQQSFAHWLIDAGCDLIIGMHPHVMQGYEIYHDKYIFYSLGNFVFDMAWHPTKYGLIVQLDVETNKVGFQYVHIDDIYCPRIILEKDVPEAWRMEKLCKEVSRKENIEVYIKNANNGLALYRNANYKHMLLHLFEYDPQVIKDMMISFIKRRLGKFF